MPFIPYSDPSITLIYSTLSDGVFGVRSIPETDTIAEQRKKFLSRLGITQFSLLVPVGRNIVNIETHQDRYFAQGIISQKSGQNFGIFTSDCPALIIIDPASKKVGLLHLGWWQLYKNILGSFTKTFLEKSTDLKDVKIILGPSICYRCFTLTGWKGWLRIILFSLSPYKKFIKRENNVYSLDLRGIALHQLALNGFTSDQIIFHESCTCENAELASYRRQGKNRASSNFIVVKIS